MKAPLQDSTNPEEPFPFSYMMRVQTTRYKMLPGTTPGKYILLTVNDIDRMTFCIILNVFYGAVHDSLSTFL